jgi:2-C-methyl-D-erythritol 2,4-cyclodiphosphate synthase
MARRLALVLGSACAFAPRAPAWAARSLVAPRMSAVDDEPALRCGHGYDIHRMAPRDECPDGQPLVIGGVRFDGSPGHAADFELGCVAHSDGDVIYHSVVDAILGALTLPDIGQLFPDNDPRLRGADSSIFMEEAYSRMTARGYRLGNVDVTLIAQKPRVNVEHAGALVKERMSGNLARLLRTDVSRVNVKARTHEKVDSVGECRAIECHVSLILERDPSLPERRGVRDFEVTV